MESLANKAYTKFINALEELREGKELWKEAIEEGEIGFVSFKRQYSIFGMEEEDPVSIIKNSVDHCVKELTDVNIYGEEMGLYVEDEEENKELNQHVNENFRGIINNLLT